MGLNARCRFSEFGGILRGLNEILVSPSSICSKRHSSNTIVPGDHLGGALGIAIWNVEFDMSDFHRWLIRVPLALLLILGVRWIWFSLKYYDGTDFEKSYCRFVKEDD